MTIRYAFLIFALSFTNPAIGQIHYVDPIARELSLRGHCGEVKDLAENLNFALFGESRKPQIDEVEGVCEIKYKEARLPKVFHSTPWQGGDEANCWGFAASHLNIIPRTRYMENIEFEFWIKSPLCELVEKPVAGDLGVIDLPGQFQLHTFVHVDSRFRFSKHGPGGPIVFESSDEIAYMSTHTRLRYFRCSSVATFFSGSRISGVLLKHERTLESLLDDYFAFQADPRYRVETLEFYDNSIRSRINELDDELLGVTTESDIESLYRRFLRVRLAELRRNITHARYWTLLSKFYREAIYSPMLDSASAAQIFEVIENHSGTQFIEHHQLRQRIRLYRSLGPESKLHVILDSSRLSRAAIGNIFDVLKKSISHLDYFVPISSLVWEEDVVSEYHERKDDLNDDQSPYNLEGPQ